MRSTAASCSGAARRIVSVCLTRSGCSPTSRSSRVEPAAGASAVAVLIIAGKAARTFASRGGTRDARLPSRMESSIVAMRVRMR